MIDSTKSRVLQAAGQVVLQRGVSGLTLEAVADAAGLSKGGLLYHYSSKDALVTAMVRYLASDTDERIAEHQLDDRAPGGWTRGYLQTCAMDGADAEGRLATAILAAGATDPGLLAPLRERQAGWRQALGDDGIDRITAHVVRLAADGLWMNDIFGLPVLSDDERAAVLEQLERLTDPDR